MINPYIMNRIIGVEDAARRLRNLSRGLERPASSRELCDLADCVAQGFQAMREALDSLS